MGRGKREGGEREGERGRDKIHHERRRAVTGYKCLSSAAVKRARAGACRAVPCRA